MFFLRHRRCSNAKSLSHWSFDAFHPERDIFFTVTQMLGEKNYQRIPPGHGEGWANKFLPHPRRPSTRTEDPVRAGRLSGAEECYEKLLKRSELWSLSRANQSRQQCDAPQGILKHRALCINSDAHNETNWLADSWGSPPFTRLPAQTFPFYKHSV